ncbi:hypothetical protein V1227_39775 [Lentzea sp. DG1S-22]|uniref:hypothetical protein n=1 Tax=Lentzea sp. DG1S-22 TaxID=3108822 RepID=UPI002E793280|nr:hypothetical protein [Lentzea sp. DG1S-22]WVH81046.1 hypothetical protein V1227_39775 [Lentzea sp. DG1S-22]
MSEQGQTPPPREPSQDRAQNDPRAARPAPDQATTPLPADAAAGQQPAPDQPAAEPPPPAAATPSVAVPARPGRVRRLAGHRATQVVAAGLLGLVLGGGIVGAVAADRSDHRGGPGHARVHERGDREPDRGDRFEQRGPFGERGDRFER